MILTVTDFPSRKTEGNFIADISGGALAYPPYSATTGKWTSLSLDVLKNKEVKFIGRLEENNDKKLSRKMNYL